jgi:3-oxoacyl-[acyl-carrier-protein] synthase III
VDISGNILFRRAGSVIAMPLPCIPACEVDDKFGVQRGWTEANFAISYRFDALPDETSSMLAVKASAAALLDVNGNGKDLNVLTAVCRIMEEPITGTAPMSNVGWAAR